jgi:hypothetical protein
MLATVIIMTIAFIIMTIHDKPMTSKINALADFAMIS